MSLHRLLTLSLLALNSLILLTASVSIINMVDEKNNANIISETHTWANVLAKNSRHFINSSDANNQHKLKNELRKSITTGLINRVHIYRLNEDGAIEYFSSYNKNHTFPAIGDKIGKISQLRTVHFEEDYIELIVEITDDERLLGYLFIQSSLLEKQAFIKQLIYIALAFLLFTNLVVFAVSTWLFNKITQPMATLIDDVEQISQSKNYQLELASQPYKELDILAKNINILLRRTHKYIDKIIDEQQYSVFQKQALEHRLNTRTEALKESNQELLSTLEKLHEFQGQLVETEKMASLGDMVAGIAHEINTPIGLGVTASSLLADRLHEIKFAFENKTLKSSQLKKFLMDGDENALIILRNLERAANLISSFKKVAVDQSSAESRTFNVNTLINEVLLTLSTKIRTAKIDILINCPDALYINSKPGAINQILINLILNSIHHAFDGIDNGKVTITIAILAGQLHINYKDNGTGIEESMRSKIFEPFTTTKRGSGGSGLGMHLVYNLVTQALDGYITVEEAPTHGVSFDITFPVAIPATEEK